MWTKLLNIYIFQKWKSQNKIDSEPHLKKKKISSLKQPFIISQFWVSEVQELLR